MTRRIGIALLAVGIVTFVASGILLVLSSSAEPSKPLSVLIETDKPLTTDLIDVDTSQLCLISVAVKVQSDEVYTDTTTDPGTTNKIDRHTLQYNFPIRFRVLGDAGNVIHSQDTAVAWNSNFERGTASSHAGGVTEFEHRFLAFKVDDPGRIQVEATIEPDTKFGATLQSATLILYDDVSRHSGPLWSLFSLICCAPLLILAGIILAVVGHPLRPQEAKPSVVAAFKDRITIKRVGITLLAVGFAMPVASFFLLGLSAIRSAAVNKALSVSIEPDKPLTTDLVSVNTSRLCSIKVYMDVQSDTIFTSTIRDAKTQKEVERHQLQYNFPIRYRVLDAEGNVLHEQSDTVAWTSGTRIYHDTLEAAKGGGIETEQSLASFKVEEPGRIQVEVELEPDTKYGATLQSARLVLYDNVLEQSGTMVGAFSMICFAPVIIILGAILTIFGHSIKLPHPNTPPPPIGPVSPGSAVAAAPTTVPPVAAAAARPGIDVWYASEERANSVSKVLVLDDRGTLHTTKDGLYFAGRKQALNLINIQHVSLTALRLPWKTYLVLNLVMISCMALEAVVAMAQGEMEPLAVVARFLVTTLVTLIFINGIGLFTNIKLRWVRVEHRDGSATPLVSFFAVSNAMGWSGVLGKTEQLYNRLRDKYAANPFAAESPIPRPVAIQETVQPDLKAIADSPMISVWAVISLVAGMLSVLMACFFFPLFVTSPVAIVTGHIARYSIRQSRGRKTGGGLALAGLVIGYAALLLLIVFLALLAVGPISFNSPAVSEPGS